MKVTIFKVGSIRYKARSCWRLYLDYLAPAKQLDDTRLLPGVQFRPIQCEHQVIFSHLSEMGRAVQPTLGLNRKLNNLLHLIYHFRIGIFADFAAVGA